LLLDLDLTVDTVRYRCHEDLSLLNLASSQSLLLPVPFVSPQRRNRQRHFDFKTLIHSNVINQMSASVVSREKWISRSSRGSSNTQAKIMLGTSRGERTKSTRAPHAASHFVLVDA